MCVCVLCFCFYLFLFCSFPFLAVMPPDLPSPPCQAMLSDPLPGVLASALHALAALCREDCLDTFVAHRVAMKVCAPLVERRVPHLRLHGWARQAGRRLVAAALCAFLATGADALRFAGMGDDDSDGEAAHDAGKRQQQDSSAHRRRKARVAAQVDTAERRCMALVHQLWSLAHDADPAVAAAALRGLSAFPMHLVGLERLSHAAAAAAHRRDTVPGASASAGAGAGAGAGASAGDKDVVDSLRETALAGVVLGLARGDAVQCCSSAGAAAAPGGGGSGANDDGGTCPTHLLPPTRPRRRHHTIAAVELAGKCVDVESRGLRWLSRSRTRTASRPRRGGTTQDGAPGADTATAAATMAQAVASSLPDCDALVTLFAGALPSHSHHGGGLLPPSALGTTAPGTSASAAPPPPPRAMSFSHPSLRSAAALAVALTYDPALHASLVAPHRVSTEVLADASVPASASWAESVLRMAAVVRLASVVQAWKWGSRGVTHATSALVARVKVLYGHLQACGVPCSVPRDVWQHGACAMDGEGGGEGAVATSTTKPAETASATADARLAVNAVLDLAGLLGAGAAGDAAVRGLGDDVDTLLTALRSSVVDDLTAATAMVSRLPPGILHAGKAPRMARMP